MSISPYKTASPDILHEIIREAEARLEAQLSAALGADQRAMTFAGLLFAADAVLIGAALAIEFSLSQLVVIMGVALGLTVSAALSVYSAQPAQWEYVGNVPSAWLDDIAAKRDLHDGLAEMAAYYDDMITTNENSIRRAGRLMKIGIRLSLGIVILGAIGALIVAAF